jgi:hypothetical protein
MTIKDIVEHREFLLHWKRVTDSYEVPAAIIANAELSSWFEPVFDKMVVGLSTYVLTDRLDRQTLTRTTEVPDTWWQHTKLVHFPTFSRWLRRPPRMRTITLSVEVEPQVMFPEANYPRQLGRPVRVAEVSKVTFPGKP